MNTQHRSEVLVVGNGALGIFLASELAARGLTAVTVVGPAARPGGASQAAGAMLGCFSEVTTETLASAPGRAKFELGLEAHRRWPEVLDSLSDESTGDLWAARDTYVVLNTAGGELDTANFDAMLSALREYGGSWDEVTASDIEGYRPRPDRRALRAIRLTGEGAIDGRLVLDAAQRQATRRGVRFIDATVTAIERDKAGRASGVRMSTGETITARTVVVAAGAYSRDLYAPLVERHQVMPLFGGAGFALVVEQDPGSLRDAVIRTPNRAFACGLHSVPLGGARTYLGATNAVVPVPQAEPFLGDAQFLANCAMEQIDQSMFHARVTQWRSGNRPVPLDGFPMIGWTSVPGLYLMTGTYRDGYHCAPVLAEQVADQILGKEGGLNPLWHPERTPLEARTVEQSAEMIAVHRLASWFEADSHAPPQVAAGSLAASFRDQARQFYDRLGLGYGLGADVLMYFLNSLHAPHVIDALGYLRRHG